MEEVLVGIDNEHASQVAVDWVIDRARGRRIRVTLVTMFDMIMSDPTDDEQLLAQTRSRMQSEVPELEVETSIIDQSIHEGLVERSKQVDLLVLGSHPGHRVPAALSAALPIRVAAHAHCPVVIVPDDWTPRHGIVLTGVGDDDTADRAVLFAAHEAEVAKAELEIVHTWQVSAPTMDFAGGGVIVDIEAVRDAHRDILRTVVERVRGAFPKARITGVLDQGHSGSRIASRLSRARLVVLGTRGRGPISGLILGSTLQEVLRAGKVPVCVVPLHATTRATTGPVRKRAKKGE